MTQVRSVVTFPNTNASILRYLVQRTADTIGAQVDRVDVIVVGRVQATEMNHVPVEPDHEATLRPWLVTEESSDPHLLVQRWTVAVKRQLKGAVEDDQLQIAYVYPNAPIEGDADTPALLDTSDRGLMFLCELPADAPYTPYISRPAYQMAPGEVGVRSFLASGDDEQGESKTREDHDSVEQMIEAVTWYTELPHAEPEALQAALLQRLDDPNSHIARHAIRTLALKGDPTAATAFERHLSHATTARRVRLMLGLWLLGEQETVNALLKEYFQEHGKWQWLAQWEIRPTEVDPGQPVETLYGPDPDESKGD